jgi:hypothetical protein
MPRMNLGLPFQKCNLDTCLVRTNLQKCGTCKVVLYCSAAHQRTDWMARHKASCNIIKTAIKTYNDQTTTLGLDDPNKDFSNDIGHLYSIQETRPYMQSRFDLMTAILNIRTGEAVEAALSHALEMLRLCRGDNLGVRFQVPALYLRLGRDQEAYDFIKWWMTTSSASDYSIMDLSLPYLDLHGHDVLESFDQWKGLDSFPGLSFFVALALIKLRLLLDVELLKEGIQARPNATNESKMELMKEEALGDIILLRPDIVNQTNYDRALETLAGQLRALVKKIQKRNKHFWPGILRPELFANRPLTLYTEGSQAEATLAFRESWYSWSECEKAVQVICGLIGGDN